LVVDDDPDLTALAGAYLGRLDDVSVRTATDPNDALDRVDDSVDCVVSDYEMPGMDGLALLDAVDAVHPDADLVLLTAAEGYGLADREAGRTYDPDVVQTHGSITKQMTAAAILLLESRGLLAVGDSLDETVPRPWADVYRAICRNPSTVLEDLVFAIGAHIKYDLPHALLEVGTETDRLADYHLMNEVLASRTDTIQDAVTNRYNRTISRLDQVIGDADEVFTNYWLRIGRSMAWYNAMRMQSPRSRAAAEDSIERSTSALIESVRTTGPWFVRSGFQLSRYLLSFTRRWPSPPPPAPDGTAPRGARW
jgi:CheY-like chemotaxis protein